MISLGIKSLNESNNPSDADVGIDYITVKYTPKVIVTIQNSFSGGTVEVDGSIKTSPWTSPSTGTSVWYSGDSHSIRAYTQPIESVTYPFEGTWTKLNSSTQISQTSENTPVTINPTSDCTWRADFGNPAVQVTVDQQLSNGTSTESFDYWEEGSGFINYTVPRTFLFEYPTTQTLRGSRAVISGEKFSKWNIDYDVKNHRAFLVDQTSPTLIISQLGPVVGDVTINVNLSGTHSIQFKDPWYNDYPDENYEENLRNRGVEAIYRTRTVPFTPNYSTVFENGQTYQGVLLNQNPQFDPSIPIYKLKASLVGSVTQSDIYAFTHWSVTPSSGADFEDSTAFETAVVFKTSGATVTAVYTAVNQIANYTLSIPSGETLTIPAGASISFADGFEIIIEGNFIAEGTESDRIAFTGVGKADEYACDPDHELLKITGDNSILTLGYLDITNTYGGITLDGNNLNVNIHDMKIEDSNVGILIGESLSNSEILIDGIVFENNNVAVNAGRRTAEMDQETNVYFVRSVFSNNDFNIFVDRWDEDDEYQSIQNYHCYRCDFIGGETKVMNYGAAKENSEINLQLYQNIFYDYTAFHLSMANDVYSGSNIAYLVSDLSYMGATVVDPQFINASICDYRLKSASPCIDAGGQIFGFDESETDPDGTTYDIGAYYYPQESLSGTIATDRSLFGRYNFQSNVTISSGATLTIDAGSVINGNNNNLRVYGSLVVNGTANNRVKFNNTYIYCSGSGPIDIEYADISASPSKGLWTSQSQVILNNCTFTNNGNDGAYLYFPLTGSSITNCIFDGNSRYGTWVYKGSAFEISNNKFRNHTNYYGLALTEFNGSLYDNYFENNKYGIGFDKGNANLLCDRPNPWEHCGNPGDSYVNNVIRNNSTYGVHILASSTPMIGAWQYLGSSGSQAFYRGGYNAFIDNDDVFVKYIKSLNSTAIDISSNFWDTGGGSVLSYVEGTFDEYPNWFISQTSLAKSRGDLGDFSEDEDYLSDRERTLLELELFLGDSLLLDSLYAEAFTVYDNLINTNPGQIDARTALNRIIYMFQITDDNVGLQNYLDQILLKYPDKSVGILAYDYSSNRYEKSGDFQTSLNVNDQAGEKYENIGDLEGKAGALFENLITCEMVASDTVGENSLAKRTSI